MAFDFSTEYGFGDTDYDELSSNKTASIFLIDATKAMFKASGGLDITASPFGESLKCVTQALRQMVMQSPNDMAGIVFFGCEKTLNHLYSEGAPNLKHVYIHQSLDVPTALQIRTLKEHEELESLQTLKEEIGHNSNFVFGDALWVCGDMLQKLKSKNIYKQILIFTCNDDPHPDSETLKRAAYAKAGDIQNSGVDIFTIPIFSSASETEFTFCSQKFYANLAPNAFGSSDADIDSQFLKNASARLEELKMAVLAKNHQKRPVSQLRFSLGSERATMSVKVYNLVRSVKKPTAVKITRQEAEEVKKFNTLYRDNDDSGEEGENKTLVMPQDIVLFQTFGGKRAVFEQHEVKQLKNFGKSGLTLIGFKPLSSLKLHCLHYRHGHLLYPNESDILGSTKLFSALLDRCLAKKVYALCRFISRKDTPPQLVALIPNEEKRDSAGVQLYPPGFHVAFLPFADDIRNIPRLKNEPPAEVNDDEVEAAEKVIVSLQEEYRSRYNPSLQRHWNKIEGSALQFNPPEPVDSTLPRTDHTQETKSAVKALTELIIALPERKGETTKRTASQAGLGSSDFYAKVKRHVLEGTTSRLTVADMKDFARCHLGIATGLSGVRKNDLIEIIEKQFTK